MHISYQPRTCGKIIFLLGVFASLLMVLLAACTPAISTPPSTLTPTPVQMQVTATATMPEPAMPPEPTATVEPAPAVGFISGVLSFPSDEIPPLRIYAVSVETGDFISLDTNLNQTSYTMATPPGVYHLIAYAFPDSDNPFPGGYTKFVPCGLSVDCSDHTLIPVQVAAGATVEGIDILDWYATADAFSPPPDGPNPPARPAILPAPLYFLHPDGEVMRLEADGFGRQQITFADAPVSDFDISPTTDLLAYVSANELHIADAFGQNDSVILTGPEPVADESGRSQPIHFLQISPGGRRIAYALDGVRVIDIDSGESILVQANDAEGPGGGTYWPIDWSPDGTRLLVGRSFFTVGTALQVNSVGFEDSVFLGNGCCHPAWSPDSQHVYVSGPYYGARVEPGLRRYDLYNGGAVENLIAPDPASDTLPLIAFAQELAESQLYSFRSQPSKQEYSDLNGQALFQMVRSAADGVSDFQIISETARPLQDVLWADDGSGAVIMQPIDVTTAWEATVRLRWLPAADSPAIDLPAIFPTETSGRLRWGPTDEALAVAQLKAQFLADARITLAAEGTYEGFDAIAALPLQSAAEDLWAVHTAGFRDFAADTPRDHLLAIYQRAGAGWQQRAIATIGVEDEAGFFGPDYLAQGSVKQVTVEPQRIWLEVHGGMGAHGGTYQLFNLDGDNLVSQAASSNSSPGGSSVADINGDGIAEVLLDATDYYVFCYACGVRYAHFGVLRWDWNSERMVPVEFVELNESAPAALRELNNEVVALAQAGLWKQALAELDSLDELNRGLMGNPAVIWNIALIRLNGEAKNTVAQNGGGLYPILENLFFGDYAAAVEPFRAYSPDQIFAQPSALVTGTVAESWEESIGLWVFDLSDAALPLLAARDDWQDQAAAHLLRAWAAYINDPTDPAAFENIARTVQLTPNDSLYHSSFAYLKGKELTTP